MLPLIEYKKTSSWHIIKIEGNGKSHMNILLHELLVSILKLFVNLHWGNVYMLIYPSMVDEAHTFNW